MSCDYASPFMEMWFFADNNLRPMKFIQSSLSKVRASCSKDERLIVALLLLEVSTITTNRESGRQDACARF